jgi:hypothetical protein
MKTRTNTLGIAGHESERAKHENRTLRPRYRRKRVPARKTWKRDPSPSRQPKTCFGAQNMKTAHSAPSKTSPEAQNMKTEPDTLKTAENESGSAKLENETQHALRTAENVFGMAKQENGT